VQSVEYRSSGVTFSASPRIYCDRVLLKISQQLSNFAMTQTSNIDSPTLVKRALDTTIELNDGEVIVLAGLDEVKDSDSSASVPFFGFTFGSSDSRSKSHILLMLEIERVKVDR
jgi:type II secretory pathway component GspD/PulD (secretin)